MPFKSEKQRRFMWSQHPDIAKRWAHEKGAKNTGLPTKLTDSSSGETREKAQREKCAEAFVKLAFILRAARLGRQVAQQPIIMKDKTLFVPKGLHRSGNQLRAWEDDVRGVLKRKAEGAAGRLKKYTPEPYDFDPWLKGALKKAWKASTQQVIPAIIQNPDVGLLALPVVPFAPVPGAYSATLASLLFTKKHLLGLK